MLGSTRFFGNTVDRPDPSSRLRKITTITFDADDTLWDFQSAMEQALEATLRQLRLMVPNNATEGLTVQKMIEIRDSVADELDETKVRLEEIRHAAYVRTLEFVGLPSLSIAEQLFRLYIEKRDSFQEPYPDTVPTLKELKQRFQIGIISNGNSYPERMGLADLFDFTVFAHDYGFPKPDSRIFDIALSKGNCRPEQVIHVGDSLQNDVLGANNVGLSSVWLNRERTKNETEIVPDYEIQALTELINLF